MKPVERGEVLGIAEYEPIRDRFRARVIEEKKRRRIGLGPHAMCVFENHDTVLLQIQEMIRTERISREDSVLHEIATYNQLVPGDNELSATIMIEIDEREPREKFLVEAKGLDRAFALVIDGERCPGMNDVEREHPDRTTAVHYLKFPLGEKAARALKAVLGKQRKADEVVVEVVADHPRYTARAKLPPAMVAELAQDLA
ncbi:hypothetical protein AKJ09_08413 [Labilithrix luteola]|uniref:DUF3501 family protein n=1 Tax=Labilithrix luteola TaxID=1391654 RepID=A0A0K1Q8N8_9BACT|nr:DUF3501 family protein [Labilithrix luteola]AKV01750.1 hypothetical protein AKJ09_08413 [Labilithrix luteola]